MGLQVPLGRVRGLDLVIFIYFLFFETESHCAALAGLELTAIFLC